MIKEDYNKMIQNKYCLYFLNTLTNFIKAKGQLIGRVIVYSIIVFLFSEVFKSVNSLGMNLWYVAITQFLIMSSSSISFDIESDIKNDDILKFLLRPINYLFIKFVKALSVIIVKSILLGLVGLILCFYLTETYPNLTMLQFLKSIFFIIGGFMIYTLMGMNIGLLSFWIKEIKNIFFLNMTLTFCFGGLIVSLDKYPAFFKNICFYTPYPWILYAPANKLTTGYINHSTPFLYVVFWCLIFILSSHLLYKKVIKNITK
jgi:ABC-2 type transport system permease protein